MVPNKEDQDPQTSTLPKPHRRLPGRQIMLLPLFFLYKLRPHLPLSLDRHAVNIYLVLDVIGRNRGLAFVRMS